MKCPIAKSDMKKNPKRAKKVLSNTEPKDKITICPNCKKDYNVGVKAAYKLGLLDGRNHLQQSINCIKATHRVLFNELLRLDRDQPRDDCCIKMSRDYAEKLIKLLRKCGKPKKVGQIQKMINEQIHTEITLE